MPSIKFLSPELFLFLALPHINTDALRLGPGLFTSSESLYLSSIQKYIGTSNLAINGSLRSVNVPHVGLLLLCAPRRSLAFIDKLEPQAFTAHSGLRTLQQTQFRLVITSNRF
jgi:hypothetical protein